MTLSGSSRTIADYFAVWSVDGRSFGTNRELAQDKAHAQQIRFPLPVNDLCSAWRSVVGMDPGKPWEFSTLVCTGIIGVWRE